VLEVILKECLSASILIGIYAINTLPVYVEYPAALIVNLSSSNSTGSHWVAIYINENRQGHYFDSFGRNPPKSIQLFYKVTVHYIM
jgi:hypothetical protein